MGSIDAPGLHEGSNQEGPRVVQRMKATRIFLDAGSLHGVPYSPIIEFEGANRELGNDVFISRVSSFTSRITAGPKGLRRSYTKQ